MVETLDRSIPAGSPSLAFVLRDRDRGLDGATLDAFEIGDLLGWSAPDDAVAVAVVASGQAVDLDGPPGPAHDGRPPVRVVVAIDRLGRRAALLDVDGRRSDEPPAGGRLYDGMLRCLGLPTAPPPADSARFLASLWLGAIIDHAPPGGGLPWDPAVRLHPAAAALGADDPGAGTDDLETVILLAGQAWDWESIRLVDAASGCLAELCPPELAEWMDAGMFARWVLGEVLGLSPVVLRQVRRLLTSPARRRFDAVYGGLALAAEATDWPSP